MMTTRAIKVFVLVLLFLTCAYGQEENQRRPGVYVDGRDSVVVLAGKEFVSLGKIRTFGFDTFGIFAKYDAVAGTEMKAYVYLDLSPDSKRYYLSVPIDTLDVSGTSVEDTRIQVKDRVTLLPAWATSGRWRVANFSTEAGNRIAVQIWLVFGYYRD